MIAYQGRVLAVWMLLGLSAASTESTEPAPAYDEADLKSRYEAFMAKLDPLKMAEDYPGAIRKLLSGTLVQQMEGLSILGQTREAEAIPWLVLFVDSERSELRRAAQGELAWFVYRLVIKRRDPARGDIVAIKPLGPGDSDLRPLAWLVLKLFRRDKDDVVAQGAAIMLTRYLNLYEFESELNQCRSSRHPAI